MEATLSEITGSRASSFGDAVAKQMQKFCDRQGMLIKPPRDEYGKVGNKTMTGFHSSRVSSSFLAPFHKAIPASQRLKG